ncbi:MAG: hypothetical protein MZV70_62510 [Desulfobacterales bacterium]|nr:hypothetical protein [Desulfobacterales bacterium]
MELEISPQIQVVPFDGEGGVRASGARTEITSGNDASAEENASYTQLVETGKKLDMIEERAKKERSFSCGIDEEASTPSKNLFKEGNLDKAASRAVLSSLV